MIEFVEKVVYTGVSVICFSIEKAKNIFEELAQEGKISPEEGEKIVRELLRDASFIKEELEHELKEALKKVATQVSFLSDNPRLNDLIARVEALEKT